MNLRTHKINLYNSLDFRTFKTNILLTNITNISKTNIYIFLTYFLYKHYIICL